MFSFIYIYLGVCAIILNLQAEGVFKILKEIVHIFFNIIVL
jgi:hypothetical protein